jgi:hypothetical protein
MQPGGRSSARGNAWVTEGMRESARSAETLRLDDLQARSSTMRTLASVRGCGSLDGGAARDDVTADRRDDRSLAKLAGLDLTEEH